MDRPTPRVNSKRLSDYPGRTIRIIGKVIKSDGSDGVIEASDGGEVQVTLAYGAEFTSKYIEVVGKVNEDSSVAGLTSTSMGENLDMELVQAVVELTHRYPELYPLD